MLRVEIGPTFAREYWISGRTAWEVGGQSRAGDDGLQVKLISNAKTQCHLNCINESNSIENF